MGHLSVACVISRQKSAGRVHIYLFICLASPGRADHVYTVALTGILIFNFTYEKKLEEKCYQNYMKSILLDNFEI